MTSWMRQLLQLPVPNSDVARSVDQLHFFVLLTTLFGAVVAAGCTLYFVIRHHEREPRAVTRAISVPRKWEFAVAFLLMSLFVSWWVLGFRQYLHINSPPRDSYEIHVTAKQWMWKFSYPDGKSSAGVLVVPERKPIRLTLTSRDVIHSFFIPALRIKADALPGRYTNLWFEADRAETLPVYCAEYCGLDHSRMLARVVVTSEEGFAHWNKGGTLEAVEQAIFELSERKIALRPTNGSKNALSLAAHGKRIAQRYGCLGCHENGEARTQGGFPHAGPSWVGLFGRTRHFEAGGARVADEQYLSRSIRDPLAEIVEGFPASMPTYQGQMDAEQESALIAYIRSLKIPATHAALPAFRAHDDSINDGSGP